MASGPREQIGQQVIEKVGAISPQKISIHVLPIFSGRDTSVYTPARRLLK